MWFKRDNKKDAKVFLSAVGFTVVFKHLVRMSDKKRESKAAMKTKLLGFYERLMSCEHVLTCVMLLMCL